MKKIINLFVLIFLLNSCENVQKGLGMKKNLSLILLIFLFSSCQSLEKGLGLRKDIPDEFLVEKRNPLIMPPNFDLLPPDSVNQNNQKDEKDNLKEIF
ncbi:MAG: DUF3035 domain-containing protein, partial [Proteobacteria bacterium]|nr:DUF3035 domain-containing protein [Candidatus Fonsibacter lacus]